MTRKRKKNYTVKDKVFFFFSFSFPVYSIYAGALTQYCVPGWRLLHCESTPWFQPTICAMLMPNFFSRLSQLSPDSRVYFCWQVEMMVGPPGTDEPPVSAGAAGCEVCAAGSLVGVLASVACVADVANVVWVAARKLRLGRLGRVGRLRVGRAIEGSSVVLGVGAWVACSVV